MNCLLERETFIVVHEIFGVRSEGKVYAFSHAFDERIKIELMKCISRQKLQSTTTTCLGKKCIWAWQAFHEKKTGWVKKPPPPL